MIQMMNGQWPGKPKQCWIMPRSLTACFLVTTITPEADLLIAEILPNITNTLDPNGLKLKNTNRGMAVTKAKLTIIIIASLKQRA